MLQGYYITDSGFVPYPVFRYCPGGPEYLYPVLKKNTYELIDPAGIEDYIKKLEKDIIDFKNEVDYVLSESNATTFIEVNFVD